MPPRLDRDGDLAAWVGVGLVPGLGPANYRSLLSAFGLPQNILGSSHAQLCKVIPVSLATAILAGDRSKEVEQALAWLEQPGNHILTLADTHYPPRLYDLPDPPPVLYVRGDPQRPIADRHRLSATPKDDHAGAFACSGGGCARARGGAGATGGGAQR